MPIVVASFAALAVGYGLGEQAQLGEQEAQTVTQEVRHTGDVKEARHINPYRDGDR